MVSYQIEQKHQVDFYKDQSWDLFFIFFNDLDKQVGESFFNLQLTKIGGNN